MVLEALLILAGSFASMPAQDIEVATLHVRVDRPNGKPFGHRAGVLSVRGVLPGVQDRPAHFIPVLRESTLGPGWRSMSVPRGAGVSLFVWQPGHAVVETLREIPLVGEPRRVRMSLGEPVESGRLRVEVEGQSSCPEDHDDYRVRVFTKAGSCLVNTTVKEARAGLELPVGDYDVELRGQENAMCGNSPPECEAFVPARAEVRVGGEEVSVSLRVQLGSAIRLFVEDPTPSPRPIEEPAEGPRVPPNWGRVSWCLHAPDFEDAARAYLVPLEGEPIDLTWGWPGLAYIFPWASLPLNTKAQQLVPVPPGAYTLVVKGPGIQEMRTPVLLSERWTDVRVHPAAR